MKLLALGKPIKKPPRSDERDGELFCGTLDIGGYSIVSSSSITVTKGKTYFISILNTSQTMPSVSGCNILYKVYSGRRSATSWYEYYFFVEATSSQITSSAGVSIGFVSLN